MSTDLAIRSSARELAAAFAQAEQDIRATFARLAEIEERLNIAFCGTPGGHKLQLEDRYNHGLPFDDPDEVIARLSRYAWKAIVDRLELRKVMSVKRWGELEKQLDRGELPPITEQNVFEFARAQREDFQGNLVDTIVEVYEWLRPRSRSGDDYATNARTGFMEIGERVILERYVEIAWSGGFQVGYHVVDRIDALDRIMLILDGKAAYADANHHGALYNAIHAAETGHVETEYFEARCHKKGTLHLRFKRADLLAKLNKLAGGKRLRQDMSGAAA